MRASLFYLVTVFALTGSQAAIADSFPQVRIETTAGDFVVELDADRSPISVKNFLRYVESGFYEGTIFHCTLMVLTSLEKKKKKKEYVPARYMSSISRPPLPLP